MIDFNEMKLHQEEGLTDIESLKDDEKQILRHYCSLVTEAFLTLGVQSKAPVDKVILNAYRNGIALGLHLKVAAGILKGRS